MITRTLFATALVLTTLTAQAKVRNGRLSGGLSLAPQAATPSAPAYIPQGLPKAFRMPIRNPFTFPKKDEGDFDHIADANSPVVWFGDLMVMFNSAGHPWRSEGPNVRNLSAPRRITWDPDGTINGARWMEAVVKDTRPGSNILYGFYHNEPAGGCPGTEKTSPRIGKARSVDGGRTWEDLGLILISAAHVPDGNVQDNCHSTNHYFVGGHGDFSVMLDKEERSLYFFFSSYDENVDEQGISVAVMDWGLRDTKVDWKNAKDRAHVMKWYGDSGRDEAPWFRQPGINGNVSPLNTYFSVSRNPLFRNGSGWHSQDGHMEAFWGPSIHYNEHLDQYVMLLNKAVRNDETWKQDGIYISFNPTLEDPSRWSAPYMIYKGGPWYPQIVSEKPGMGSDKWAGCRALFFIGGKTVGYLYFIRPEETRLCVPDEGENERRPVPRR